MNKKSKIAMVILISLLVVAVMGAYSRGPAEGKRAVNPPGTEAGLPFSNGIIVGNTFYVAGQQGFVHGKLAPGGIGPETRATLETIRTILKAGGYDMKDVVAVNVYLADIHDFGEMNKVYKTFFPDPKPTRTTIQAGALVNNARIEISAVAAK
jgi:2-iminobutanoate/2-iminopropanoate deaminase